MEQYNEMMKPEKSVGYGYVINQKMKELYPPEKAMEQGTIFPQLDISMEAYERGLYNGR